MSKAPEKYVIGLTGNIGTGKSVVRRMLQQLGAFTIDADALSHRAIARGAPGYEAVQRAFGSGILNVDGEINRAQLGAVVFADRSALQKLEAIVHPLVRQAIGLLMQRADQPVVVIEAIKLLEGKLPELCDSIWVTYAPTSAQLERLTSRRAMSREQALLRINAQGSQADKMSAANVVIRNLGSFSELRRDVERAWGENVPAHARSRAHVAKPANPGEVTVTRAAPEDHEKLVGLIEHQGAGSHTPSHDEVMAAVGPKTYLLLHLDGEVVGWAIWSVENLVACTADVHYEPTIDFEKAVTELVKEIERMSADLQCEASLLFLPTELGRQASLWKTLGYEPRAPEMLTTEAWRDAAIKCRRGEAMLFFKQLSSEPIFDPIGTSAPEPTKPGRRPHQVADA